MSSVLVGLPITDFDVSADSLRLDLPDGVDGDYTIDDLNGMANMVVEGDPFEGSMVINFGSDDNGDAIGLEIAGVTDASQVDVTVV